MDYQHRLGEAHSAYILGKQKVQREDEPLKQKFPIDSKVRIADNLGHTMSHFPSGCNAIVCYSYAHAYGGDDVKSYCLNIDGHGEVSWYNENQLTLINNL